ncbi:MAG: hypothetical protein V3T70_04045 [Phycisphaerae bacterium]
MLAPSTPVSQSTDSRDLPSERILPVVRRPADAAARAARDQEYLLTRAIQDLLLDEQPHHAQFSFDTARHLSHEDPRAFFGVCLAALARSNMNHSMNAWEQALRRFADQNGVLDDMWFDFTEFGDDALLVSSRAKRLCKTLRLSLQQAELMQSVGAQKEALLAYLTWRTDEQPRAALEKANRAVQLDRKAAPGDRIPGIPLLYQRLAEAIAAREHSANPSNGPTASAH